MKSGADNRQTDRFPINVHAIVRSEDYSDKSSERLMGDRVVIENISSRGALFASRAILHEGQLLSFTVNIAEKFPSAYSLKLEGWVVRKEKVTGGKNTYYAVEFNDNWQFID